MARRLLTALICLGMISSNLGCFSLNLRTPVEGFASRIGRLGRAALVGRRSDRTVEVPMINIPGQRFTATHGIKLKKGDFKLFIFTVDSAEANYAALSGNIAYASAMGGPEKYNMYLKYGAPPTTNIYDYKAKVAAFDSYVGAKLYSRDIRIQTPAPGQYYLLIEAVEDFSELLITAIVDYPPDYVDNKIQTDARTTKDKEPGFTIQRMGKL